jgi:pentose-5-phosphate-3-epimerase/putative flippase GtrA
LFLLKKIKIKKHLKKINLLIYRYRFLFLYVIFGFLSLVVELVISKFFLFYNVSYYPATFLSFIIGLFCAFFLNVRFNFHITPAKRKKALLYFSIISTLSFSIQLLLRSGIQKYGYDMDISRFVIAGSFFMISYALHRKLSFREYKKVGVAIYADGVEDIKLIFDKISNISDFIHIDIVYKTYNPNCKDVKAYRAEVVRAYWQNKKIEVHIMSKNPSVWLDDLLPYVDVIYVHPTMHENLSSVIDKITSCKVEAGIALSVYEPIEIIDLYIENKKIKHVLLLTIPQPGFSGQKFDVLSLPILEKLNVHKNRSQFEICVDGGVNDTTVKYLNVESVVSGSYILSAPNPIKNIMHLQTSGEYAQY